MEAGKTSANLCVEPFHRQAIFPASIYTKVAKIVVLERLSESKKRRKRRRIGVYAIVLLIRPESSGKGNPNTVNQKR